MNFEGDPEQKESEFVAINPVIVESEGRRDQRPRGVPELSRACIRTCAGAKTVKVQAYNLKGELYEMVCHDLPARVWQHEIDHLDGVLFIDKMGSLGLHRSQKDLEKFIADFEKDKKKGDLPPGLEPKL